MTSATSAMARLDETSSPSPTAPVDRKKREETIWQLGLTTPIRLYGKVVDENGTPVEGANVHVSIKDQIWQGNTKIDVVTDKNGAFSITGQGLGLAVMVSKTGYYHLRESDGTFGYAPGAGAGAPHSDPRNPAVFVLRKMGKGAPLVVVNGQYSLAKNGMPFEVSLTTGKETRLGEGDIRVEAWTDDQEHQLNSNQSYNWRWRITAPNGGLVPRTGEFDFEAPLGGYTSTDELNMPVTLGSAWRKQARRNYFVRLGNGTYARVDFTAVAEGDHFFAIKSYLNPVPNERNLEFDENKVIR